MKKGAGRDESRIKEMTKSRFGELETKRKNMYYQ